MFIKIFCKVVQIFSIMRAMGDLTIVRLYTWTFQFYQVIWFTFIADVGQFTLSKTLCIARGLQLCSGDFICLRSHVSPCIFHCCVSNVDSTEERDLIQINLVEVPDGFSVDNLNQTWLCSMEVIARGLSFRRMISAVKNLGSATELIRSVILRRDIPKYLAQNPRLIRQSKEDITMTRTLNPGQEQAVMNALASPLTLIQGPPGIYKTSCGIKRPTRLTLLQMCETLIGFTIYV